MKNKAFLMVAAVVAIWLTGCSTTEQGYPDLSSPLAEAQGQVTALQGQIDQLNKDLLASKADNAGLQTRLDAATTQVRQLQEQINKLKQDNQLTGATPAETAQKIIKLYHETHVYSSWDLFICGDMSQEVWNMLKAQNINARIQVGRIDRPANELIDSDHAWVLAEVAPGELLALETTAGYAVTRQQNPLYYQGWSFQSPKDYKEYADLLKEYNLRVAWVNDMADRYKILEKELDQAITTYNQMVDAYNRQYSSSPSSSAAQAYEKQMNEQLMVVKEKEGRLSQANIEYNKQKALMPGLLTKMKGLVS